MDKIIEWFNSSPSANVVGIILIILAAIILFKFAKEIAKPVFTVIFVVLALLLFFNVLDLAMVSEYGIRMLSCMCAEAVPSVSLSDVINAAEILAN